MLLNELADMAAALVLDETWEREPRASVSATCPNPSESNPFWILKMKARKVQVTAAWGKSTEDLHDRVVEALGGVDLPMMRRFARKARNYMRGYARHHGLFGWDTEEHQLAGLQEKKI